MFIEFVPVLLRISLAETVFVWHKEVFLKRYTNPHTGTIENKKKKFDFYYFTLCKLYERNLGNESNTTLYNGW